MVSNQDMLFNGIEKITQLNKSIELQKKKIEQLKKEYQESLNELEDLVEELNNHRDRYINEINSQKLITISVGDLINSLATLIEINPDKIFLEGKVHYDYFIGRRNNVKAQEIIEKVFSSSKEYAQLCLVLYLKDNKKRPQLFNLEKSIFIKYNTRLNDNSKFIDHLQVSIHLFPRNNKIHYANLNINNKYLKKLAITFEYEELEKEGMEFIKEAVYNCLNNGNKTIKR